MRYRPVLAMTPFGTSISLDATATALFLSDLHLGDGTRTDLFAGQDGDLISFLERQRDRAATIVFLGDILDMPQAWRTRRIRAAHPAAWRYLTRLARDARVVFVRGNHDWSVDYAALFPGAACCEAVLIGDRTLAWHGHQVDLIMNPGARDATLKTYVHALLERAVGRRLIPPLERYDSLPNRIAMATAVAWARASVARARMLRSLGRSERAAALEARVRYLARSVIGDPADMFGATERNVLGNGFDTVVCGHSHMPGRVRTPRGVYVNTGTWTCGLRTFARWAEGRFRVADVDSGRELGDEDFAGLPPETEPDDLFRWWARHHRGLLRFDYPRRAAGAASSRRPYR